MGATAHSIELWIQRYNPKIRHGQSPPLDRVRSHFVPFTSFLFLIRWTVLFTIPDYEALNEWLVKRWKEFGRKQQLPNFRYCHGTDMKELRKKSQNIQLPRRGSNRSLPKYKSYRLQLVSFWVALHFPGIGPKDSSWIISRTILSYLVLRRSFPWGPIEQHKHNQSIRLHSGHH